MKFKRFLKLFLICFVVFAFTSIKANTSEIDKHSSLSYIYGYGGEDFSYDDNDNKLVSIEDYDTIDMFMDMSMEDIAANMGVSEKIIAIPRELPKPVVKKQELLKKPLIAIIIDDMGVNRTMSTNVLDNIKQSVTLSFLPYASNLQEQVDNAKKMGHEIILHLPWEPYSITANSGPNSLQTGDSKEQIYSNLIKNLDSFTGYEGLNNHMGSKFSVYRKGIEVVMKELKKRDLFFIDSLTDNNSIAEQVAREYGLKTSHRNVFLDHIETDAFVAKALQEVERIALTKGSAIAIGHPKDVTIKGLTAWLPTLEARGFKLVTVKEVIKERHNSYNVSSAEDIVIRN